jgi:hypothetical protein
MHIFSRYTQYSMEIDFRKKEVNNHESVLRAKRCKWLITASQAIYHSRHRLYIEYSAAPVQKPPFEAFFSSAGDTGVVMDVCSTFSDPTEETMSVVS